MMIPHHIGCIVADIDEAVAEHRRLHSGSVSEKILVTSQQVWVCFAELQPGFFIEFVQQAATGSAIDGLLKKKVNYYHIGYKTSDLQQCIAMLEQQGFKLLSVFASEAFNGKECAFLFGTDARLIELISA